MRAIRRLLVAGLVLITLAPPAFPQLPGGPKYPSGASAPAAPREEKPPEVEVKPTVPALPTLRLGAMLPLTGPAAWFGKEMRQGLELAVADLNAARAANAADSIRGEEEAVTLLRHDADQGLPFAPATLALETADVKSMDAKKAADEFNRLAGMGAIAVFTASVSPTLAIQPLALARNVLVVHQGFVDSRLLAPSRVLVHTRPSIATYADALVARAEEEKLRQLGLLAAGDEFGKALRAAVSARWRERGRTLAVEESLTPEASDLASRLRHVTRLAPDALVLGYRGTELGDMAARLREVGYQGKLYLLDDDVEPRLAAGPALGNAVIVSEAFDAKAGARSERFAEGYKKKFGDAPSRYAASAYDAAVLVAAGIRAGTAGGRGVPGGARLREVLLGLRDVPSLYGGPLTLRTDGALARPLALFRVEGMKLVFLKALLPAKPS